MLLGADKEVNNQPTNQQNSIDVEIERAWVWAPNKLVTITIIAKENDDDDDAEEVTP